MLQQKPYIVSDVLKLNDPKQKSLAKAFKKMSHRKERVEQKEPLQQQLLKLDIKTLLKGVSHMPIQY